MIVTIYRTFCIAFFNKDYDLCMFVSRQNRVLFILFLIVYAISALITYHVSRNLLDEDASAELLLAKCIYDERSLLPSDWYFGNEYRVNFQLILAPLFAFFSDWGIVRFVGVMIMQILLVCSFIFMLWQAKMQPSAILTGCILILLPWCVAYGRIVLYHCYYTPCLIFSFLILGLFFRVYCTNSKPTAVILFFICLLSCLNGIRQFYAFFIPFCAVGLWRFLRNNDRKMFFLSLVCMIFGFFGLIINKTVIMERIHVGNVNETKYAFNGLSSIFLTVFAILRQFSYRSNVVRTSFLGFMSLAGIATAVFSVFSSAKGLLFEKNWNKQILKGFLFVQLLWNMLVFLFYVPPHFSRYDYSRYLLTASIWVIPLFCCLFEEKRTLLRRVVYWAVLGIFVGNSLLNFAFFGDPEKFSQDYDGLSYTSTSVVKKYANPIHFIQSQEYDLGYAVCDANVLTEKLNGLPIVWLNKTSDGLVYLNLLTRRSFRNVVSDKAFFIGTYDDAASFRAEIAKEEAIQVYSDGEIFIYTLMDQSKFKHHIDIQSYKIN